MILSDKDLKDLNITYEEIYYNKINTKKVIIDILSQAKAITGFNPCGKILLIEVFPNNDNGCTMYFSLMDDKKSSKDSVFGKYSFEYLNIEDLINSSIKLFEIYGYKIFKSSLYIDKKSKKYFLTVTTMGVDDEEIISFLKEFSTFKEQGKLLQLFIDEHYHSLIKDNALEIIYNNFK